MKKLLTSLVGNKEVSFTQEEIFNYDDKYRRLMRDTTEAIHKVVKYVKENYTIRYSDLAKVIDVSDSSFNYRLHVTGFSEEEQLAILEHLSVIYGHDSIVSYLDLDLTFEERLKVIRNELSFTYTAIAEGMGYSSSYVSNMSRGNNTTLLSTKELFLRELNEYLEKKLPNWNEEVFYKVIGD